MLYSERQLKKPVKHAKMKSGTVSLKKEAWYHRKKGVLSIDTNDPRRRLYQIQARHFTLTHIQDI